MPESPAGRPIEPFRSGKHVRGRAIHLRLSLIERLRAARRVPQAVVKVASYQKGAAKAVKLMNYITRNGALELETGRGESISGREAQKSLADQWALSFDHRKNGKDFVHLVFSMPRGSDPEALRRSVRTLMTSRFKDHESGFSIHQDQAHPHAHTIVVLRGANGQKLRLNKAACHELRERFAEAAREEGVELAVSPRAARGVSWRSVKQAVFHAKRRGEVARSDHSALEAANTGVPIERPWERAMQQRFRAEKKEYEAAATRLKESARGERRPETRRLVEAAEALERFSAALPSPRTRAQDIRNAVRDSQAPREQSKSKERDL